MLAPSMSQNGLQGLRRFVKSIEDWKSSFDEQGDQGLSYLKSLYGYIEEYGTGGALFRNLYCDFLQELTCLPELREGSRAWRREELQQLESNLPTLRKAASLWTELAGSIKAAVESEANSAIGLLDHEGLQNIGKEIFLLEESFWQSLKGLKP
ncbi:hypothetical protein ES703_46332 [subsurface metagenome]